jgi:hypothetical protein
VLEGAYDATLLAAVIQSAVVSHFGVRIGLNEIKELGLAILVDNIHLT